MATHLAVQPSPPSPRPPSTLPFAELKLCHSPFPSPWQPPFYCPYHSESLIYMESFHFDLFVTDISLDRMSSRILWVMFHARCRPHLSCLFKGHWLASTFLARRTMLPWTDISPCFELFWVHTQMWTAWACVALLPVFFFVFFFCFGGTSTYFP